MPAAVLKIRRQSLEARFFSRIDGYAIKYRWSNSIPQIANLTKIPNDPYKLSLEADLLSKWGVRLRKVVIVSCHQARNPGAQA